MSKRILNDKDRKALLAKYKDDRMNDAPANISDKVLIENYGTDEQKALLATPATQAGEAKQNQATTPSVGSENPPATPTSQEPNVNEDGKIGADAEREHQVAEYKRLYGVEPSAELPTNDIAALNLTKQNELDAAARNNPQSQEYIDELNRYISLHNGQAPATQLSFDELYNANEQKVVELSQPQPQTPAPANKQFEEGAFERKLPNVTATTTHKDVEKVSCVHKDGRKKQFTKYTYEQFIAKDKDWKLVPQAPKEVQEL